VYVLQPSTIAQVRRFHVHAVHSSHKTPAPGRESARIGTRCGTKKMRGVVRLACHNQRLVIEGNQQDEALPVDAEFIAIDRLNEQPVSVPRRLVAVKRRIGGRLCRCVRWPPYLVFPTPADLAASAGVVPFRSRQALRSS